MNKTLIVGFAVASFFAIDQAALAQTPAVGDSSAATVGQDAAVARHREINRERRMTTGSAAQWGTARQINRGMRSDRMLPERTAPDAEQAAPAGR